MSELEFLTYQARHGINVPSPIEAARAAHHGSQWGLGPQKNLGVWYSRGDYLVRYDEQLHVLLPEWFEALYEPVDEPPEEA